MKTHTGSVLWITERIDVLKSQFDNTDKIDLCIASGLLPNYSEYEFITWYNKRSNVDELNEIYSSIIIQL